MFKVLAKHIKQISKNYLQNQAKIPLNVKNGQL